MTLWVEWRGHNCVWRRMEILAGLSSSSLSLGLSLSHTPKSLVPFVMFVTPRRHSFSHHRQKCEKKREMKCQYISVSESLIVDPLSWRWCEHYKWDRRGELTKNSGEILNIVVIIILTDPSTSTAHGWWKLNKDTSLLLGKIVWISSFVLIFAYYFLVAFRVCFQAQSCHPLKNLPCYSMLRFLLQLVSVFLVILRCHCYEA